MKLSPSKKLLFPFFKVTFLSTIVCLKAVGPFVVVVTSTIPLTPDTPLTASHCWLIAGEEGIVVPQK